MEKSEKKEIGFGRFSTLKKSGPCIYLIARESKHLDVDLSVVGLK